MAHIILIKKYMTDHLDPKHIHATIHVQENMIIGIRKGLPSNHSLILHQCVLSSVSWVLCLSQR